MAHGRLISRLTLSVNTMLTWMWITRGDGHVSPGLGGYAILRKLIGEAEANTQTTIDAGALRGSRTIANARCTRNGIGLTSTCSNTSRHRASRRRDTEAASDRGVRASRQRPSRSRTSRDSSGIRLGATDIKTSTESNRVRGRIGGSNAANQSGNSDKQQFLHSLYSPRSGMPPLPQAG